MCYLIDFPTFSTIVENFLSHQKCMHIWIIRTSFSKFYRNKISHYIIIRLPVHFVQPIKYSSSRRQVPLRRYWYLLSTPIFQENDRDWEAIKTSAYERDVMAYAHWKTSDNAFEPSHSPAHINPAPGFCQGNIPK